MKQLELCLLLCIFVVFLLEAVCSGSYVSVYICFLNVIFV